MPAEIDEDFIRAKVAYDMALRNAQGNHSSFSKLSFRDVQMMRDESWVPRMLEALADNTTCTELDLCNTGLTDVTLQKMAVTLAAPLDAASAADCLVYGGRPPRALLGPAAFVVVSELPDCLPQRIETVSHQWRMVFRHGLGVGPCGIGHLSCEGLSLLQLGWHWEA